MALKFRRRKRVENVRIFRRLNIGVDFDGEISTAISTSKLELIMVQNLVQLRQGCIGSCVNSESRVIFISITYTGVKAKQVFSVS